jgi:protein SCO1/2
MHCTVNHTYRPGRKTARVSPGLKFEPVDLVVLVNALTNRAQKPHRHPEPSLWEKFKGLF